jgi:hypothetical protein
MKEHIGDACPVAPGETVRFDLGDGRIYVEQARDIDWGPGGGPNGEGRVLRYEIVRQCSCAEGKCVASDGGRAIGRVSVISDIRCMERRSTPLPPETSAAALLDEAKRTMQERAREYDQPGGERNMAATVAAFNAITGHSLQESEGWLFMEVLKARRDFSTPHGHADSQRDRIAYAALGAEARRAGR